jgi:hypothetical protein
MKASMRWFFTSLRWRFLKLEVRDDINEVEFS